MNSTRKPLNLIKSPIFTNAPCKTACLHNAPSMHTLDYRDLVSHRAAPGPYLAIPASYRERSLGPFAPRVSPKMGVFEGVS